MSEGEGITEHIREVLKASQQKLINGLSEEQKKTKECIALRNEILVEVKGDMAQIRCNICSFICKAYGQSDTKRNKKKWVMSNVNRHIKTHFKTDSNASVSKTLLKDLENKNSQFNSRSNHTITSYFKKPETSTAMSSITEPAESMSIDLSTFSSGEDVFSNDIQIVEEPANPQEEEKNSTVKNLALGTMKTCPIVLQCKKSRSRSRQEKQNTHRFLNIDLNQTKLTEFYEICENIKTQINENPVLSREISTSTNIANEIDMNICNNGPQQFFEMIKAAVKRNSTNISSGNRFSEDLKKLCLYLYLTSGRLAYQTLICNIPKGLPSISTLSRQLSESKKLCEGALAIDELSTFIKKRNFSSYVFISEDQTAIVRRPRYNLETNQLTGYVLSNSEKTGFPKMDQNLVNSVVDIKNIIDTKELARNAYVYMAQPLQAPAFCVTIFGSNNSFRAEDVLLRWKYIQQEALKHNIQVAGFSSDGDSRCLKAMKSINFHIINFELITSLLIILKAKFCVANPVPIQDTVHIGTKLKIRLLNPKIALKMGNYKVSKGHLVDLINNLSKDQHLLCHSYLDGKHVVNLY